MDELSAESAEVAFCGIQILMNQNSDMNQQNHCWFKILTAPGPGAVAVIQLSCHQPEMSQFILRRVAATNELTQKTRIGRICYGRWNNEDLVVVRTSEHHWEIQCHGGAIAVNRICCDLQDDGVVESVSFSGRLSDAAKIRQDGGIPDLVQLLVETRLTHARSRKAAGLILAQASNSLGRELKDLVDSPVDAPLTTTKSKQNLSDWQDVADHLTQPWRVVMAGAPNVGKSSLVNMLAGMDRSIVYNQPGTTRDVVEVDTIIEGWPFRFIDTAGLRENSEDHIEELGIQQSQLAAAQSDVLCIVVDANADTANLNEGSLIPTLPARTVLVRNKCDLLNKATLIQSPSTIEFAGTHLPMINVSALTGEGLSTLLQWIKTSVVPQEPNKDTVLPLWQVEVASLIPRSSV